MAIIVDSTASSAALGKNFLQLCQDTAREAGMPDIASAANQKGEPLRMVNWVRKAYRYILNLNPQWQFLRADAAIDVIAGQTIYYPTALDLANFGEWRLHSFRAYDPDVGVQDEQFVTAMPDYDYFRDSYGIGPAQTTTGRPQLIAQRPDQALVVWPTPDRAYTLSGEYFKAPPDLVNNTDVPVLPPKYHDAIVWRALMFYGQFEGDSGVFATGQMEFRRVLAAMELLYAPAIQAPGAMA